MSSTAPCRRRRCSVPGPAHIATLKTFDPPLAALEGGRLAGARRRGKHLLFPTERRRARAAHPPHERGSATAPARRREGAEVAGVPPAFENGSELVLTEAGPKKRAGVWLESPATDRGRARAPRAGGAGGRRGAAAWRSSRRTTGGCIRSCATSARWPGSGVRTRTRSCGGRACLRSRSRPSSTTSRSSGSPLDREDLERALELRIQGKGDKDVYLVHRRLGEPCPHGGDAWRRPDRARRLRGAHGLLLRRLPDGRACLEGSPALAPAPLGTVRVRDSHPRHVPALSLVCYGRARGR